MILSDWAITDDCAENCRNAATPHGFRDIGMPWGVESLSPPQRFAKGVTAGLDQFDGVDDPAPLVEAVRSGAVPESRLDASVRRILLQKFQQGLFEHPFVDPDAAVGVVGSAEFRAEADAAQRRAMVVIENAKQAVPMKAGAEGHLPFALPRSMADVEAQSPGRPHDLASPLYPFGWPR